MKPSSRRAHRAAIVLATEEADLLEALASGILRRSPDLARDLLDEIARARIVPGTNLPSDVVALGRRVVFRDETTGQEKTVMLVPPSSADIARGQVSVLTPIGVALIGLRVGARFTWSTRAGQARVLTVVQVTPAPTGASDLLQAAS